VVKKEQIATAAKATTTAVAMDTRSDVNRGITVGIHARVWQGSEHRHHQEQEVHRDGGQASHPVAVAVVKKEQIATAAKATTTAAATDTRSDVNRGITVGDNLFFPY